jgi:glycosyltransferase involved in cell wall biosynthesis
MHPRVSICVPNLNTRPFLSERLATIFGQTLQDWELLLYDSYSDDGAWEYLQGVAESDSRVQAWQGPREGTPGSWTPCVRRATGDYVYIATSDDTMAPDCLDALAAALDAHPDCDIAHCPLRAIDEHGMPILDMNAWWARHSMFARSSGSLVEQPHVRRAPFDGILHLEGGSVYTSITQLLIRRSLFDRIGFFEQHWGSIGDFHWAMRAGLVANTVHVPATWGGWRLHSRQATAQVALASRTHAEKIDAMIDDALRRSAEYLDKPLRQELLFRWAPEAKAQRAFVQQQQERAGLSAVRRAAFVAAKAAGGSAPARALLAARVRGGSFPDMVRRRLSDLCYGPPLVPDQHDAGCAPGVALVSAPKDGYEHRSR